MHRLPRSFIVILLTVAAVGPAPAQDTPGPGRSGADIRGRVEVRRGAATVAPRPTPSQVGAMTPAPRTELRPAVVFLDSAPRGAFERDDARARMDQRHETFVPHVLAVTVGTVVDFPNSDPVFHNVFSLSKAKPFDLGRYAAGGSKSVRFDRPGVVQVFCEIHSHMSAYILVFAHRYYAVTGEDGAYRIRDVPPGTYTAVVWYEGNARESRTVVVNGQDTVDLDFVVR